MAIMEMVAEEAGGAWRSVGRGWRWLVEVLVEVAEGKRHNSRCAITLSAKSNTVSWRPVTEGGKGRSKHHIRFREAVRPSWSVASDLP